MKNEIEEKYIIQNGILKLIDEFVEIDKNSLSLYEVIRVIEGVPLFLEKHIQRLKKSAELIDNNIEDILDIIGKNIKILIEKNDKPNKNIKIILYNINNELTEFTMFFIRSNYPTTEQYTNGVKTILVQKERKNPNAKIVNQDFKEKISIELKKSDCYEALLVNSENEITEGSRSNIFFVKNNSIYTPPIKDVLPGITRNTIIEMCKSLNIDVIEDAFIKDTLKEIDGIFLTGTSPNILPISYVNDIYFESVNNIIIKRLMKEFIKIIDNYIHKSSRR